MNNELKAIVEFQAIEIRKFIQDQVISISKLKDIDVDKLQKTISNIQTLIDMDNSSVKNLSELLQANKNNVERVKQELKDLIIDFNKNLSNKDDELNNVIITMTNKLTLLEQIISKKDIPQIKIDVYDICNVFNKHLWNLGDYINIGIKELGTGNKEIVFKLSSDIYNIILGDNYSKSGNPIIKIIVNNETIYNGGINAIKVFNQYELIKYRTDKEIESFSLEYLSDIQDIEDEIIENTIYLFEVKIDNNILNKDKILLEENSIYVNFNERVNINNKVIYDSKGIQYTNSL